MTMKSNLLKLAYPKTNPKRDKELKSIRKSLTSESKKG